MPAYSPSNLLASDGTSCSNVEINWSLSPSESLGQLLYRDNELIADLEPNVTSYQDWLATSNINHTYCIEIYNECGNSSQICNPGSLDTSPNMAQNVIASDGLYDNQITIIWDENYNTDNSFLMYYYESDFIPKSEKTYKIEVNHPDYNSINATTFIEKGLNIYDLSIDSLSNIEKINFTFSFDDNANKQNYYRLKLFASCEKSDDYWGYGGYGGYGGGGEPGYGKFRGIVEMQSNDPSFPQTEFIPENGYTFIGEQVIFSDALFNGQKKTISVDVETYFKLNDCDTISFEFSTFSEDTYSYFSSLGEHRDKGELGIFGGEVIPVYSNVYNGLGVLISVNSQQFFVKPTQ